VADAELAVVGDRVVVPSGLDPGQGLEQRGRQVELVGPVLEVGVELGPGGVAGQGVGPPAALGVEGRDVELGPGLQRIGQGQVERLQQVVDVLGVEVGDRGDRVAAAHVVAGGPEAVVAALARRAPVAATQEEQGAEGGDRDHPCGDEHAGVMAAARRLRHRWGKEWCGVDRRGRGGVGHRDLPRMGGRSCRCQRGRSTDVRPRGPDGTAGARTPGVAISR
jgi:hypothetical protein